MNGDDNADNPIALGEVTVKAKASGGGGFWDTILSFFSFKKKSSDEASTEEQPTETKKTQGGMNIFSIIGQLADPIAKIFVSKDNLKLTKLTTEQLKENLKLAEAEQDNQKIILAGKALALKEAELEQETKQKTLQGGIIIAALAVLAFIAWLLFSNNNSKNSTPKVS